MKFSSGGFVLDERYMENKKRKNIVHDAIIKEISQKTQSLKYGIVVLKVHDGKIVQTEVTEKTRLDDRWIGEEGGGI